MDWQDIVYDIPLTKKQRKAALAKHQEKTTNQADETGADAGIPPTPPPAPSGIPDAAPGVRRILSGINGSVHRGEMCAILGASGAGKTTLLNILSARLDSTGDLSGRVTFEGKPRDPKSWKRTVGFVEQDDLLISFLTVRETLGFAARLRLPDRLFTKKEKMEKVEEVIDILRMEKCEGTRIGSSEARGVSGGERKRVAIGSELVSDVSMLLLDEPTSGLDSFQAINVVSNLKEIAVKRNLACLMTIHQPSWKIFAQFDNVILLTRGGVFYSGPPKEAPAYFERLGFPTPEGSNPADHFINLAENFDRTDESEKRVLSLLTSWQEHQQTKKTSVSNESITNGSSDGGRGMVQAEKVASSNAAETPGETEQTTALNSSEKKASPSSSEEATTPAAASRVDDEHLVAYREWPTSWISELTVLSERKFLQIIRNPITLIGTAGQTIVLCIIIGFAFFRLGDSQADVLARIGVLFFIPINASFAVIFPILAIFPLQRAIMRRERASGLYRTSSFYVSQVLVEIPAQILQRFLFYVLIYFMIGLRTTAAAFFIYMAVNVVQVLTAIGIGFAIGSLSPTVEIANIIAPLVNVIFLLFGGNLLPSPPPWYIWIKWISPITYAYSALSQNEYRGEVFSCDGTASGSQCYPNGASVIAKYNLAIFTIAEDIGFLFAIFAAWLVIGYVALRVLAHPKFRYI